MSVFVTYPRAGDGSALRDRPGWDAMTPPARVTTIWPAIGGVGLRQRGVTSAEAGGADSDQGEWRVGSRASSSALAGATTAAVKMMPAKVGAASSNLEVKFLSSQACREIGACRANRAKNQTRPQKARWPKNENTLRKSPMSKLTNQAAWFSDNEKNWNDRANLHMAGDYCGLSRLLADPNAISAELALDIGRFGDLAGKQVMHLQCHVGTDTIGFARRGAARVVGLDLSETSLAHARAIADKAGADVEYVHANVYDARQAVSGDFDLVYTSIGVLCWLPDVVQWARVIASLLKPGGTFFIRDDHPMFMAIGEDVSDGLKVEQPYFQLDTPMTWDDDSSYVDTPGAPRIAHTTNHQWNHSLGQIITALIDAGLVVDGVEEFTYSAWCPWPWLMEQHADGMWRLREQPERLPLQFAISAHKV